MDADARAYRATVAQAGGAPPETARGRGRARAAPAPSADSHVVGESDRVVNVGDGRQAPARALDRDRAVAEEAAGDGLLHLDTLDARAVDLPGPAPDESDLGDHAGVGHRELGRMAQDEGVDEQGEADER